MKIKPRKTAASYTDWQTTDVVLRHRTLSVVSKPGVFAHGWADPSTQLLAEHVRVEPGTVVVNLNCGNGTVAAAAAVLGQAGRVLSSDRSVLSVAAAQRTLAENGVANGDVVLAHGGYGFPPALQADVVAVRLPQEKLATLQLLWDAFKVLRLGGRCYLAGAKNEGIGPAAEHVATLFGDIRVVAHRGGHRVVVAEKTSETPLGTAGFESPLLSPDSFHGFAANLHGSTYQMRTRPGIFSWDHVDEATALLADGMTLPEGASVLDLGCGSGALGLVAARLVGDGNVMMTDVDVEAIRSARESAAANSITNCQAIATDVAEAVQDQRFDVVVTNPPFHVGKATDLMVPLQFIEESWNVLAPGGQLLLVANRTLPYEGPVRYRFGNLHTLHNGQRFKILMATRSP